jgi:hypothetical protein
MLADPEKVDTNLIGENTLIDEIANRLTVRERPIIAVSRDVAERVKAENERKTRGFGRRDLDLVSP